MNTGDRNLMIIGGGAMGSALAGGIATSGVWAPEKITVADLDVNRLKTAAEAFGVKTTTDAASAAAEADVVLIALKPGVVRSALGSIGSKLKSGCLVISIAAGVKIETLENLLPQGTPVIRAMPNTPCQVGAGAVVYSRGSNAGDEHAEVAQLLFGSVGVAMELPENMLDAVTGLSGSGPAYIFVLIEAMSDAGVAVGLPRDKSTLLAAQTVLGSAKMVVETGKHPGALKDQVTSPGGTTIAGVAQLEKAGFRSAMYEAVKAATQRSRELG